jgi:hypothetical protein
MDDSYKKIARILRIDPASLMELDKKMREVSGQKGVIEDLAMENKLRVDHTLAQIGMDRSSSAEEIYEALIKQLTIFDGRLFDFLGKPDLSKLSHVCGKMCETLMRVFTPPRGLFIKKERVVELLEKYPPNNLLEHFGYKSVKELVEKEGFAPVVASLRFVQETEWMHKFFDTAYQNLKADDFEEREVEMIVLDEKWLKAAEKFLKKKYHNISHLKEFGVIFVIPIKLDEPGEMTRMFMLLIHYLHEVPFYSDLFRMYFHDKDFISKFQSLLRGDVPSGSIVDGGKVTWRIIQRYIAKDNENDPRLFEPHVNPEAEHWFRAEQDLGRLARMIGHDHEKIAVDTWMGLDFVGDFFKDKRGQEILISFDLIDLSMSLADKGRVKYLYHHEEALWNKIFAEYMGRETMNRLINENIIEGFIVLQ